MRGPEKKKLDKSFMIFRRFEEPLKTNWIIGSLLHKKLPFEPIHINACLKKTFSKMMIRLILVYVGHFIWQVYVHVPSATTCTCLSRLENICYGSQSL